MFDWWGVIVILWVKKYGKFSKMWTNRESNCFHPWKPLLSRFFTFLKTFHISWRTVAIMKKKDEFRLTLSKFRRKLKSCTSNFLESWYIFPSKFKRIPTSVKVDTESIETFFCESIDTFFLESTAHSVHDWKLKMLYTTGYLCQYLFLSTFLSLEWYFSPPPPSFFEKSY